MPKVAKALVLLSGPLLLGLLPGSLALAQRDRTVPPQEYYLAFSPYFEGDYTRAVETFRAAARGGVRSTEGLWVDSICYYTMMGECYYQMGEISQALESYNSALKLAAFHSNWLLRVEFPEVIEPSASSVRTTITWGVSKRNTRLARVPDRMVSFQGRLDNDQVLKQGGVVAPAEFYPLNVKEIVRCTALAIKRRFEIMGPVCRHDPLTGQLLAAIARRPTHPNHWSQAWISCHLGLMYVSTGQLEQAVAELNKSLVLAGQYDHELTALALLSLAQLAFDQGQANLAADLFLESSYAAAAFDQFDVIQEALEGGLITHLTSGQKGLYPPLVPAATWARRSSRSLQAWLTLLAAENCASVGDAAQAATLLGQTRAAVGNREMRTGVLGNRFNYLSALVDFQRGSVATATTSLANVLTFQKTRSRRLFRIGLADGYYKAGTISQRLADELFTDLLREPTAADWSKDPLETLTVVTVPHLLAMQHWFEVVMLRKDDEKALEIADRMRRLRFYSTLPLGGRLLAFRWVLEAPEAVLPRPAVLQRQDLLARYPAYKQLSAQAAALREQLRAGPLAPDTAEARKAQTDLFEKLAQTSTAQEIALNELSLRREPSEFVFPPLAAVKDIQARIPEGQLVLTYFATDQYITAFALSKEQKAVWQIEPGKFSKLLGDLLRQLGLNDRKLPLDAATLQDAGWRTTSAALLQELSNIRDAATWDSYRELVVVPDGPLWYVPFETLMTGEGGRPLIAKLRIRYVPTLSLANGDPRPQKPGANTVVIAGKMFPGQDLQITAKAFEGLRAALPEAVKFTDQLPAPSAYYSAICDRAIVLNDLEASSRGPYGWAPFQLDRTKAGSGLDNWLTLPWPSPEQLVLPGFHSAAETGLKRGANGNEIFWNVCALMACGNRSILLSRWPVGGQNSFDLIREYVQELPFAPAAEAWQRSVLVVKDNPIEASLEPRVKGEGLPENMKAWHPFFWAGYACIDTGSQPPKTP